MEHITESTTMNVHSGYSPEGVGVWARDMEHITESTTMNVHSGYSPEGVGVWARDQVCM